MKIVRLWLYRAIEITQPQYAYPAKAQREPEREVEGRFEYYIVEGEKAERTNRKEARRWEKFTSSKVETLIGYPAFMHDMGYRV